VFQERFKVKCPPSAYCEKLKGYVDHGGGVARKVRYQKTRRSTFTTRHLAMVPQWLYFYECTTAKMFLQTNNPVAKQNMNINNASAFYLVQK
jgi:hypothetical protein